MFLTRLIWLLCCALILGAPPFSVGLADEHHYRLRDGNRMEGLNDVPTASLDLRVVSFLGYRENPRLLANDYLKLKFYVPSGDPVFITASEMVPTRHYFMEPVRTKWPEGWQEFSQWPANALLVPEGIDPANLGVVARLISNEAGSSHLVPVLFYVNSSPAKLSSYKLRIVSRETLSSIDFGLKRYQAPQVLSEQTLTKKYFSAGTPITLRMDLTGERAGWFELWIEARVKDQLGGPKRTYFFFHQPNVSP